MIVSVSLCKNWTNNHIKMREVETEEEAFYEMRRYLEVNDIYSDQTYSGEKREDKFVGEKGIYRFVIMSNSRGGDSVDFAIHYTSSPDYASLDEMKIYREGDGNMFAFYYQEYLNGETINGLSFWRYNKAGEEKLNWSFEEFERYEQDLRQRAGDEQCR